MKKIYKLQIIAFFMVAGSYLFAQNIELPDVVTVIEGDSIKAGLETLPDFSDVLVVSGDSGHVVPKLPDVDEPEDSPVVPVNSEVAEKTIFAEGLIGGGYPTLFEGNFAVFRMTGESPFKIEFDYNSANGYANHPLTDGYYDRNAKLYIEKAFKKDALSGGITGYYEAINDGLQKRVEGISSINHETYDATGTIAYAFGKGFTVGSWCNVDYYNRYADVTKGSFPTVSVLGLNPDLYVSWEGYGTKIAFDTAYLLGADSLHRGAFTLSADWKNDFIKVFGNAAAVVGTKIGENAVVVPFTLGVNTTLSVPFSSRKLSAELSGGIESKATKLNEVESKYKFTIGNSSLAEESNWFGKLGVVVPVGNGFTGNFDFEYKQTAFNNKLWTPDYTLASEYGCYGYKSIENQQANSKIELSYHRNFITLTGGWKSYWLNVPALESKHTVTVDVNLQDEKARWGADVNAEFGLGDQILVPVINMEAFARLTSAVRAVISVNDTVELIKAEQRVYAGQYIGRGGNVSALLKFFF